MRSHLLTAGAGAAGVGLAVWLLPGAGAPTWAVLAGSAALAAASAFHFARRMAGSFTAAVDALASFVTQLERGHPRQVLLAQPQEFSGLVRELERISEHLNRTLEESGRRQRQLSGILASLADGCMAVDPQGRIILFNQAAARLFGVSEREALGRPLVEVTRSYDLATAVGDALASGAQQVREFHIGSPAERILQVISTPLTGLPGDGVASGGPGHRAPGQGYGVVSDAIWGAVALVRDVTELRHLERVRSDFVANVSHELRTPLTALKGFIETLLEGEADDEATRRRFLEIMARETDRLVALIQGLLELSRLESRAAQLNTVPVSVEAVARTVAVLFRRKAEAKGLRLELDFPDDLPPVLADEAMLRQVFINLLDNAVKYTRQGDVRVSARFEPALERDPAVVILVCDTGIGIPRQHLGRIFERFYRVDRARSRELGGSGLGLSIVRHIVEAHGGRIEVESEVGVGTTFRFWLPAVLPRQGGAMVEAG